MTYSDHETAMYNYGYHNGHRDGLLKGQGIYEGALNQSAAHAEDAIRKAFDKGYQVSSDLTADKVRQASDDGFQRGYESAIGAVKQASEDNFRYGIGAAIRAIDVVSNGETVQRLIPAEHVASVNVVIESLASVLRDYSANFTFDSDGEPSSSRSAAALPGPAQPGDQAADIPSVTCVHHCRQTAIEDDHARTARILLGQDRGLRVALAEIDPDSDAAEFLDHHVPECFACYRDLISDVAVRCTTALTLLYETPERATETLRDELEISSDMIAEHDSVPPPTSHGEAMN